MGRKFSKISQEAFKSMQFNSGIVVNKFDVTGTTEVQDADIITATTGGRQISPIWARTWTTPRRTPRS